MTSSNGNIFRVTGPLCGEFSGPGECPAQRPVTRSFDVFFDLRLNKRLSKQWWGWWFETPSCPFWRHHNVLIHIASINYIGISHVLWTGLVDDNANFVYFITPTPSGFIPTHIWSVLTKCKFILSQYFHSHRNVDRIPYWSKVHESTSK